MPELSQGLFQVMRRIDGARFNGHVTSSLSVSTKEKPPYRVLYARRPSFLRAGDVVFSKGGEVIILMEHPDDFPWAKSFKVVYALDKYPWTREQTEVHPIAKVQSGAWEESLGELYISFDSPEEFSTMGFADTKYRFITGQDVRVGDKVGKFIVKRVVESLGVKVVFAS